MENSYNARCPAVKRLLREAQELHEATEEYYAHPLEDNLFEWHFTVRGPPETEFEGGVYHGRIIMPAEYPMKPPNIIFFTPNGRFETNKKICLSISGHHPETWQPSWSIRTALLAIIGFMPTSANGTIGSLDYTPEERAVLSKRSIDFMCPNCGRVGDLLKERTGANEELQKEAKAVTAQMVVTGKPLSENERNTNNTEEKQEENSEASNSEISASEDVVNRVEMLSNEEEDEDEEEEETSLIDENRTTNSPVESVHNIYSGFHSPTQTPGFQTSNPTGSPQSSLFLMANNILLSAAVVVLVALVLRRLFLLEENSKEDIEDILL